MSLFDKTAISFCVIVWVLAILVLVVQRCPVATLRPAEHIDLTRRDVMLHVFVGAILSAFIWFFWPFANTPFAPLGLILHGIGIILHRYRTDARYFWEWKEFPLIRRERLFMLYGALMLLSEALAIWR